MSKERSSILLLSTSSEVAESVITILDSEYDVIRTKNLAQSFEVLDSKRPPIAILDFAAATSMNGDTLDQLKKHKPELVTLLVCPRDKRDQLLESNLSNETYRVLFATLSPGQTRLAVAAALKHAKAKASEMPKSTAAKKSATKKSAAKSVSKSRPTSSTKNSSSKLIPIIAGLGVLGLAAIGWYFVSGGDSDTNPANSEQAELEKTPAQIEAETISATAKVSLDNGILFPPEENNALDAYSRILELDPTNFEAKKALLQLSDSALGDLDLHIQNGSIQDAQASIDLARQLGENKTAFLELIENSISEKKTTLISSAEEALGAGNISDAASLIGVANSLFSDDESIQTLQQTITAQQQNLDQAAEIDDLINKSRDSINNNRLLSPNRNNAQYFINRLERLDSDNASLTSLKRNLSSALLLEARTFALENNFATANRYVDSAARLGASTAAVSNERQRINSLATKVQEQTLAEEQAAQALAEQQLLAETERLAQEQAAAQAEAERLAEEERQAELERLATVPVNVKIADLTSNVRTPPEYPAGYQRRNVEGSATIAFTVQRDGSVNNVRVVSVEPESRDQFGEAAQGAVEQWSFQPYRDSDGNARIANTQIKIRFEL